MSARDVGWRALAAGLSDLAAMGADPGEAYLALGCPPGFGEEDALGDRAARNELAAPHRHHDRRAATSSWRPPSRYA